MVVAVTPGAEPLMVIAQDGTAETPPAGTLIVNVKVVPDNVPETVPRKTTAADGVDAVTVPATELPDCEMIHVMRPGPDESEAVPE
jgi:hypothetical protein